MTTKLPRLQMAGFKPKVDLATQRRADVKRLYEAGHRHTEIADALGITQARVSQIMLEIDRKRTNKRRMLRKMPPPETVMADA